MVENQGDGSPRLRAREDWELEIWGLLREFLCRKLRYESQPLGQLGSQTQRGGWGTQEASSDRNLGSPKVNLWLSA